MPDPADTSGAAQQSRARLPAHQLLAVSPAGRTDAEHHGPALHDGAGATNACNVAPQSGDLGIGANARLIAPGSAANSLIVNRMNRRDCNAMPPLGSNLVDTAGVALMTQWINGLTGC